MAFMGKSVDQPRAFRDVLALLECAGKFTLTLAKLGTLVTAIFLPPLAAYELWRVGEVEQWREVTVRIEAVERKAPTFGKGQATWRYTFTDPELSRTYETGDIEPGDLPFAMLGWSTTDRTARDYQARIGQIIHVRRSQDGQHYSLRTGDRTSMTIALGLCAAYWLWLIPAWQRRRRAQSRPDCFAPSN